MKLYAWIDFVIDSKLFYEITVNCLVWLPAREEFFHTFILLTFSIVLRFCVKLRQKHLLNKYPIYLKTYMCLYRIWSTRWINIRKWYNFSSAIFRYNVVIIIYISTLRLLGVPLMLYQVLFDIKFTNVSISVKCKLSLIPCLHLIT